MSPAGTAAPPPDSNPVAPPDSAAVRPARAERRPAYTTSNLWTQMLPTRSLYAVIAAILCLYAAAPAHAQVVYCNRNSSGDLTVRTAAVCRTNYGQSESAGEVLTAERMEAITRAQTNALVTAFQNAARPLQQATSAAVSRADSATSEVRSLHANIVDRLDRLPNEVLTAEVVAALRAQIAAELRPVIEEEVRRQIRTAGSVAVPTSAACTSPTGGHLTLLGRP